MGRSLDKGAARDRVFHIQLGLGQQTRPEAETARLGQPRGYRSNSSTSIVSRSISRPPSIVMSPD